MLSNIASDAFVIDWGTVTAIITAIGALVLGVYNGYTARKKAIDEAKKAQGDTAAVLVDTAVDLLKPLRQELEQHQKTIEDLRRRLTLLEDMNFACKAWAAALVVQVKEAGMMPVPPPDTLLTKE